MAPVCGAAAMTEQHLSAEQRQALNLLAGSPRAAPKRGCSPMAFTVDMLADLVLRGARHGATDTLRVGGRQIRSSATASRTTAGG